MIRILFFVFLVFLVWLGVRLLGSSRKRVDAKDAPVAPPVVDTIGQCAWCGVHVPHGDALVLPDGRVYCGEAHRTAARDASADRTRS